jgi:AraC-like DNA-binding protein
MQVQEVAATCGFADLASFSKAFKKAQGMAPTRFGGHKRFDTV